MGDHPPFDGHRRPPSQTKCSPSRASNQNANSNPVSPSYVPKRNAILANVAKRHADAVEEYVTAYSNYLNDKGNKNYKTIMEQKLETLKKIRAALDADNQTVEDNIKEFASAHRGVCEGAGDCPKCGDETQCNNTSGCTWTPSDNQVLYERSKDLSQQSTELADRRERLQSSMQRAEQMQQKYRYAKKVFWIYVFLALALSSAFVYLYMRTYKEFTAGGGSLGAAFTGALSSGVEKVNELKDKFQGSEEGEGEEGEGEEGEEEGVEEEEE